MCGQYRQFKNEITVAGDSIGGNTLGYLISHEKASSSSVATGIPKYVATLAVSMQCCGLDAILLC